MSLMVDLNNVERSVFFNNFFRGVVLLKTYHNTERRVLASRDIEKCYASDLNKDRNASDLNTDRNKSIQGHFNKFGFFSWGDGLPEEEEQL